MNRDPANLCGLGDGPGAPVRLHGAPSDGARAFHLAEICGAALLA
jgi:hypothetical protein